jgi:hypothetical protein
MVYSGYYLGICLEGLRKTKNLSGSLVPATPEFKSRVMTLHQPVQLHPVSATTRENKGKERRVLGIHCVYLCLREYVTVCIYTYIHTHIIFQSLCVRILGRVHMYTVTPRLT